MASRKLTDLYHPVQLMAEEFDTKCAAAGLDILIYCTYRSPEEQAELYKVGRELPGSIVTYAKPGQSAHNWRMALDFVPLRNGKPVWGGKKDEDVALWTRCAEIGEAVGFEWAGRWKRFKEFPHLQLPNWKMYAPGLGNGPLFTGQLG